MRLSFVDLCGGHARAEDAQEAELEVPGVGGVEARELAESEVSAVAVVGVLGPAAEDAFSPVGLPDVELPGADVGDEVDALDGAERGAPGGVPGVVDDVAEFRRA